MRIVTMHTYTPIIVHTHAGMYCAVSGLSSVQVGVNSSSWMFGTCNFGSYCPPNATSPYWCPSGHYCPTSMMTAPLACPGGTLVHAFIACVFMIVL
jgi:hypothetical protein